MASWQPVAEELVRTRRHVLVAFAHMLTGSRAEAEDLVQDALINTFARHRSFPSAVAAETYVRRAIASRYIDASRKRRREASAADSIAILDPMEVRGPGAGVAASVDVERAMLVLTPRERACVALRYLDQASVSQTAAALKLSEGAVKRYVYDGVAKLVATLGIPLDDELAEWAPVESIGGLTRA